VYWLLTSHLNFLPLFDPFYPESGEFDFYDIHYKEFQDLGAAEDKDIIIIDIAESSRAEIIQTIGKLKDTNAAVIGVDVYFDFTTDTSAYQELLKQVRQSEIPIILGIPSISVRSESNNPQKCFAYENYKDLRNSCNWGHVQLATNTALSPRFFEKVVTCETDTSLISFAEQVVRQLGKSPLLKEENRIHFTLKNLLYLQQSSLDVQSKSVLTLRPKDAFSPGMINRMNNKIILIGSGYNRDRIDHYFSPYNRTYFNRSLPDMPGVLFQANIIRSLIDGIEVRSIPFWSQILASLFICWLYVLLISQPRILNARAPLKIFVLTIILGLLSFTLLYLFELFQLIFRVELLILPIILAEPILDFFKPEE